MIAENIKVLRERIERKCVESGRNSNEIKLIAVSKNFGLEEIRQAFLNNIKDFGENKAQELSAKSNELNIDVTWHFIGTLQRNKVRFAVKASEYIHSVDSLELISEINKRAAVLNKKQKILLQIKTSREETKAGLADESEIFDLVNFCGDYKNVDLIGLMTIAPFTENKALVRESFRYLRHLKERINQKGFSLKELSMGMTEDFELAIEEGATMLRIGSAIFGERVYSQKQSTSKRD
jgi:pyridoxal phosphate enzyme (YggS family)